MRENPEALAHAFLDAVVRQDAQALRAFLAPDAEVRWHCSNELFTAEGFVRANCDYPGDWHGEVERVEPLQNGMAVVSRVWSKDASFHVVSFFRLTAEGRVASLDEYWSDDVPPPDWRAALQLSRPIKASP